jgi:hypothetical protein
MLVAIDKEAKTAKLSLTAVDILNTLTNEFAGVE